MTVTSVAFEPEGGSPDAVAEIGGTLRGLVRLVLASFCKDVAVSASIAARWSVKFNKDRSLATRPILTINFPVLDSTPLFKGEAALPIALTIPDHLPVPPTLATKAPGPPTVGSISATCSYVLKITVSWPSGSILGGRSQRAIDVPVKMLPSSRDRAVVLARASPLVVSNIWTEIAPGTSCPTPTALALAHLFSSSTEDEEADSSAASAASAAGGKAGSAAGAAASGGDVGKGDSQALVTASPFGGPLGEWDPHRHPPPSTPIDRGDVRYELQLPRRTYLLGDSIPIRLVMRTRSTPLGVGKRLAAVVATVIAVHSYRLPPKSKGKPPLSRRTVSAVVSKKFTLGEAGRAPVGSASASSAADADVGSDAEDDDAASSGGAAGAGGSGGIAGKAASNGSRSSTPSTRLRRLLAASGNLTALTSTGLGGGGAAVTRTFKVTTPVGEQHPPSMGGNGVIEVRHLLRISVYVEGGPGGGSLATGGPLGSTLNSPVGSAASAGNSAGTGNSNGGAGTAGTTTMVTLPGSPHLSGQSSPRGSVATGAASKSSSSSSLASGGKQDKKAAKKQKPTPATAKPAAPATGGNNASSSNNSSNGSSGNAAGPSNDEDAAAAAATEAAVKDVIQAHELSVMGIEPSLVIEVPITLLGRGALSNPEAVPYVPRGYRDTTDSAAPGTALVTGNSTSSSAAAAAANASSSGTANANGKSAGPSVTLAGSDEAWEVRSPAPMRSNSSLSTASASSASSAEWLAEQEELAGIGSMVMEEGEMDEDEDPACLDTSSVAPAAPAKSSGFNALSQQDAATNGVGRASPPPPARRERVPSGNPVDAATSSANGTSGGGVDTSQLDGSENLAGRYVVIYPFWTEDPNEICLSIGDKVDVSTVYSDGWAFANNTSKDLSGFCPLHHLCVDERSSRGSDVVRMSEAINTSISQKISPTSDWRRLCQHEPRFKQIYALMTSHKPDVGTIDLPPAAHVTGTQKRMSSAWADQERCPHCYNQAAPNAWSQ
ncbi:hypothetical protein DFJ73DRAFT_147083 [Zopfochytrium polystomum]|nr:hypothetical protein DFJ73DRAFT_147083 [Zopfochytrium polystomum]